MGTILDCDDERGPDPMDKHRKRQIERLKATPVFGPHCPECYTEQLSMPPYTAKRCRNCGFVLKPANMIELRVLSPCPAPPYTDTEIIELAVAGRYVEAPNFAFFPNVRQL